MHLMVCYRSVLDSRVYVIRDDRTARCSCGVCATLVKQGGLMCQSTQTSIAKPYSWILDSLLNSRVIDLPTGLSPTLFSHAPRCRAGRHMLNGICTACRLE